MDIIERTHFAMRNYMINHPDEITRLGPRGHFSVRILPEPIYFRGGQWSDGDLTSRALDAWIFARKITGDYETGKAVEQGQWEYFKNIINPETGLVFVPEHSYPNRDGYYYHLWDQGRALKHLVNRYTLVDMTEDEKQQIYYTITKMIDACLTLSVTAKTYNGETARYWETDTFFDNAPIDRGIDFGPDNFIDFTVGSAQLLDPVAKFYKATKEEKYLKLALELAEGFIAGFEERRGSTRPAFGENGEFSGHFHTNVSGMTGLITLAKELYYNNQAEKTKSYINLVVKSYNWIFSEANINRGSSSGWFAEGTGNELTDNSELCCTADMIELAGELAELSEMLPEYSELERLWDDVDRFTVNELFAMQILNPEKIRALLPNEDSATMAEFDKQVKLCLGGWAASRVWLHEMLKIRGEERIFYTIGCCLYSGQRGFYSYWKSIVSHTDDKTYIRFAGRYKDSIIDMRESADGGLSFTVSDSREISIRIPETADIDSVTVNCGKCEVDFAQKGRKITFTAQKDKEYYVLWRNIIWFSNETVGVKNDGYIENAEAGKQVEFKLTYKGNKLIDIYPDKSVLLDYRNGL